MPVPGAEEDIFATWAPGWLGVAAGAYPAGAGVEMPGEESSEKFQSTAQ